MNRERKRVISKSGREREEIHEGGDKEGQKEQVIKKKKEGEETNNERNDTFPHKMFFPCK